MLALSWSHPSAAGVQKLLSLTWEQRRSLVQLRGVCLTALGTIIEERNRIHALLTVRLHTPVPVPSGLHRLSLGMARRRVSLTP